MTEEFRNLKDKLFFKQFTIKELQDEYIERKKYEMRERQLIDNMTIEDRFDRKARIQMEKDNFNYELESDRIGSEIVRRGENIFLIWQQIGYPENIKENDE